MANGCGWQPVVHFGSLQEYEDLLKSIGAQVASGAASDKALDSTRAWGSAWDEKWFQCVETGEVWRLVGPDPPFRGIFKPLE